MRAEDELAHQVRAHIKFTQWATLASRRRKAIECYKEQAEDSARAAYLEQFWQAPMSTVVMDYEWPTRGGTPQARPSRSRRKSHALLGLVDVSITDTSSLKESVRAPEGSEVFAMSVAAATPRKHEGRIDTQHATVAQPLHARRKVFHSLNAVKSCVRLTVAATLPCDDGCAAWCCRCTLRHMNNRSPPSPSRRACDVQGRRAPMMIEHEATSGYKRPPRGQSTRAGGSKHELTQTHRLYAPGGSAPSHMARPGSAASRPRSRTASARRQSAPGMPLRTSRSAAGLRPASSGSPSRRRRRRGPSVGSIRPGNVSVLTRVASADALQGAGGVVDTGDAAEVLFAGGGGSGGSAGVGQAGGVLDMRFGDTPLAQRRTIGGGGRRGVGTSSWEALPERRASGDGTGHGLTPRGATQDADATADGEASPANQHGGDGGEKEHLGGVPTRPNSPAASELSTISYVSAESGFGGSSRRGKAQRPHSANTSTVKWRSRNRRRAAAPKPLTEYVGCGSGWRVCTRV